jgi:hypothetical protein
MRSYVSTRFLVVYGDYVHLWIRLGATGRGVRVCILKRPRWAKTGKPFTLAERFKRIPPGRKTGYMGA